LKDNKKARAIALFVTQGFDSLQHQYRNSPRRSVRVSLYQGMLETKSVEVFELLPNKQNALYVYVFRVILFHRQMIFNFGCKDTQNKRTDQI
jgi:hypothetical protein